MKVKSHQIGRRAVLRGLGGLTLGLPRLEAMAWGADRNLSDEAPNRLCQVFFPYNINLLEPDHLESQWNWFPKGNSDRYEFTNVLDAFETFRNEVTIIQGLCHPNGRKMGGHDTGDIFLTSALMHGNHPRNSVSMDQVAASVLGRQTRFSSLVMSCDGGVGNPGRSTTLSYTSTGYPISAQSSTRQIYERADFKHFDGHCLMLYLP